MSSKAIHPDEIIIWHDPKALGEAQRDACIRTGLLIGGLAAMIVAIGAVVAVYFLCPPATSALNAFFSQQISVAHGLLFIAVSLVAAGIVIRLAIQIGKKHVAAKEKVRLGYKPDAATLWKETFAALAPTKKQLIVTGVALALLALLAVGSYFVLTRVDVASQWLNRSVIQNHLIMWQAFAYIGGSTVVATVIAYVAFHFIHRAYKKHYDEDPLKKLDEQLKATDTAN